MPYLYELIQDKDNKFAAASVKNQNISSIGHKSKRYFQEWSYLNSQINWDSAVKSIQECTISH
jgi:hypothetical protein